MLVRSMGRVAVLLWGILAASQAAHAGIPLTADEVEKTLAEVIAQPTKPESYARILAVLPALDALAPSRARDLLARLATTNGPLVAARATFERDPAPLMMVAGEGWLAAADVDADPDVVTRLRAMLAGRRAVAGEPADPDDASRTWQPVVRGPKNLMALDPLIVPGLDQVALVVGRVCTAGREVVLRAGVAGDVAMAIDGAIIGHARGLRGATLDQIEVPLIGEGRYTIAFALRPVDDAPPGLRLRFTDKQGKPVATTCDTKDPFEWDVGPERDADLLPPGVVGDPSHIYAALARELLGWSESGLDEAIARDGAKLPPVDYTLAASALPKIEARMSALAARDEAPVRLALAALAIERGQDVRANEILQKVPDSDARRWLRHRLGERAAADASERARAAYARELLDAGRPDLAVAIYDELLLDASAERLDVRAAAQHAYVAAGQPDRAVTLALATARARPDRPALMLDAIDKMLYQRRDVRAELASIDVRWKPDLLVHAGRIAEAIGDKPQAVERYARALTIQPSNDDARRHLEALQGEEPAPLTLTAEAVAKRAALDPDAPWEVLGEEMFVKVADDGSASRWLRRVMRAQHPPAAREDRTFRWRFDPSQESVRVLGARVLSPDGKVTAVREREMSTEAEEWYGLYFDVRVMTIPFDNLVVNSLVEVTLRIDSVGQHFPGVFELFEVVRDRVPKHAHTIVIDAPHALGLAYKVIGADGIALTDHMVSEGGRDRITLSASNVPALPVESLAPGASEVSPVWQVTTFDSWPEVARWYGKVLAAQVVVTPDMKARVADVVAENNGDPARIAPALVALVQQEIRYVGLEFGIHGYKPYRTDQVWTRRFGDCKDQALLLKTLLGEAGIAADVVLLRTRTQGRIGRDDGGPLPALAIFDHAIVWLRDRHQFVDSTVVHHGMNELPAPDQGAQVLLLEDGTDAVTLTPADPATRNQVIGNYSITIDQTGFGGIQGTVAFHGSQAPYYRQLLSDPATQSERLQAMLNRRYPGLALESARVSDPDVVEAPVELVFHAGVPRLATAVGQALQVARPAGLDGQAERVAATAKRSQPVVLGPPTSFDLTFRYVAPTGFSAKDLPDGGMAESKFGSWSVTWTQEPGVVQVVTRLSWLVDQVEARDYAALRAFVRAFDEAVGPALVLERTP